MRQNILLCIGTGTLSHYILCRDDERKAAQYFSQSYCVFQISQYELVTLENAYR